jgi:hypothetical protein
VQRAFHVSQRQHSVLYFDSQDELAVGIKALQVGSLAGGLVAGVDLRSVDLSKEFEMNPDGIEKCASECKGAITAGLFHQELSSHRQRGFPADARRHRIGEVQPLLTPTHLQQHLAKDAGCESRRVPRSDQLQNLDAPVSSGDVLLARVVG